MSWTKYFIGRPTRPGPTQLLTPRRSRSRSSRTSQIPTVLRCPDLSGQRPPDLCSRNFRRCRRLRSPSHPSGLICRIPRSRPSLPCIRTGRMIQNRLCGRTSRDLCHRRMDRGNRSGPGRPYGRTIRDRPGIQRDPSGRSNPNRPCGRIIRDPRSSRRIRGSRSGDRRDRRETPRGRGSRSRPVDRKCRTTPSRPAARSCPWTASRPGAPCRRPSFWRALLVPLRPLRLAWPWLAWSSLLGISGSMSFILP